MPDARREAEKRTFPGFAGFRDDPDAPFYASRMPRFRTAEATAAEIVACFSRVVFAVMRDATRRPLRMDRSDLLRWHLATFRTTFPHQAGRLRDELTAFQIRWQEAGVVHKRPMQGAAVGQCAPELDAAFAAYNAEIEARRPEQRTVREAATAAAALYVEILRIHPFEDGSLRTAFPALQGALICLGAAPGRRRWTSISRRRSRGHRDAARLHPGACRGVPSGAGRPSAPVGERPAASRCPVGPPSPSDLS